MHKLKTYIRAADTLIDPLRGIAARFAAPVLDLAFRLYVAHAFFISGQGRLKDFLNGTWDRQVFLFEHEHPVPGVDPLFASYATTAGELVLPVLVALGLFARFGAAGLFIMALVIQLTYQQNAEHLLWMALAASIFIKGPGALSVDALLTKWIRR